MIRYITVRRTSLIIPCRNAPCNILRICFNGSEMTTCLINDQINNKRKMSILSVETLLESGKLFKKNFQSRSLDTCAASSTQCPNFRGLFTSKVTRYYTWNLKPKRWIGIYMVWNSERANSILNTLIWMWQSKNLHFHRSSFLLIWGNKDKKKELEDNIGKIEMKMKTIPEEDTVTKRTQ